MRLFYWGKTVCPEYDEVIMIKCQCRGEEYKWINTVHT